MTPDKKNEIYQAGFEAGKKHQEPSSKTQEFIISANKSMEKLNLRLDQIDSKLTEIPSRTEMKLVIREAVDEVMSRVDEKIACQKEESKEMFASKVTEKIVYGLVGIVLSGFTFWLIELLKSH